MNKYEYLAQAAREKYQKFIKCERKTRYKTEQEAMAQNVLVYQCEFCNGWHRSAAVFRAASRMSKHKPMNRFHDIVTGKIR